MNFYIAPAFKFDFTMIYVLSFTAPAFMFIPGHSCFLFHRASILEVSSVASAERMFIPGHLCSSLPSWPSFTLD